MENTGENNWWVQWSFVCVTTVLTDSKHTSDKFFMLHNLKLLETV